VVYTSTLQVPYKYPASGLERFYEHSPEGFCKALWGHLTKKRTFAMGKRVHAMKRTVVENCEQFIGITCSEGDPGAGDAAATELAFMTGAFVGMHLMGTILADKDHARLDAILSEVDDWMLGQSVSSDGNRAN